MENMKDILKSLPSISEQVEMYKSGRYDDLASKVDFDRIEAATKMPNIPVWMLRLITIEKEESNRAIKICETIERANEADARALIGTLRDSLVRNGEGLATDQPRPKMRGAVVRFAVFFMVEKFRLAGLTRDEAIDCVSRTSALGESTVMPSAKTIRGWYGKKHGPEYTGVRQFAQLIVGNPNGFIGPLLLMWCSMIARNMALICKLNDCSAITDDERAELRRGALWLHDIAFACSHIFGGKDEDFDYGRISQRLSVLDRDAVIRGAIPVLVGKFSSAAGAVH